MKVYDIDDGYNHNQTHSVVAENIAEAERIYRAKYRFAIIRQVTLHSEYVQIQGMDEQPTREDKDAL